MIMPTGKAGRVAEKNICRLLKSYTPQCLKITQNVSFLNTDHIVTHVTVTVTKCKK